MAKPRILVTGGTGFLGKFCVPLLRESFDVTLLSRHPESDGIKGDLSRWNAGVEDPGSLKKKNFAMFVHMAGLYDLNAGPVDCHMNNVAGTSMAMRLATLLEIPIFINTSSVAAAVNSKLPVVKPYDLNFSTPFPDAYSESKALAEQLVQNWPEGPRLRVNLRPGVLVGDSVSGEIARLDGPYHAAEAVDRVRSVIEASPGPFPLPGNDFVRLPLVPVDACARAIAGICSWFLESKESGYKSYHLVPQVGLPVRDFYRSVLKHMYVRNRGFTLVHRIPDVVLKKISKWMIQFPEEQLHYLMAFPKYDTSGAVKILGESWCPEFASYEKVFWSGYEKFISNR